MSFKLLGRYFTTGTAEGEDAIIDTAYVPTQDVMDIINPPPASPRVLVGRKGSGKSIVLRYFRNRFTEANIPVMLLRPSDLDSERIPKENNLGVLIRYYKDQIVESIALCLGRELKGYLAQDDEIVLSKIAKAAKARQGDWFENALNFLLPIGTGITNVDFAKLANSIGESSPSGVEAAIRQNLGKSSKLFYFLFDDTDQVADPGEPHHLNRIWAFLLALRQIMERCPNVRCIVTLRSEVWIRLGRDNATQRDQVDHVRRLVYELCPTEEEVEEIARRRFLVAKPPEVKFIPGEETALYFEGVVTLAAFDETRTWYDFMTKRSRERPRDLIQLVAMLIEEAKKDSSKPQKIQSIHAERVIRKFSRERVEDLKREVEDECPSIEAIVRSFASAEHDMGGFSMSASALFEHLKRIPSICRVSINGDVIRQMDDSSAYKLWRYLFDIGFINARVADKTKAKGYAHKSVRDDPTLIGKDRWNELTQIHWDVHPAYRDFLHEIRRIDYMGLPNMGARKRSHQ